SPRLGSPGVLLADLVELLDRLFDLRRADILLAAGRRDFLDQFGGPLDVGHQLGKHVAGFWRDLDRFRRQRTDLGGRGLAAFRKLADFGGDYRKALAVLAGARGLDR